MNKPGSAFAVLLVWTLLGACDADAPYTPVEIGAGEDVRVEPDLSFDMGTPEDLGPQSPGPDRAVVGVSGGQVATESYRLRVGVGAPVVSDPVKLETDNFKVNVGVGPVLSPPKDSR